MDRRGRTLVWLICERCSSSETKYHLSNYPPAASFETIAAALKARWACEQAHQQMKEELALDHFEGRSWSGLHHHALLTMIAFAFLQHLRGAENQSRGEAVARTGRRCPMRSWAPGEKGITLEVKKRASGGPLLPPQHT